MERGSSLELAGRLVFQQMDRLITHRLARPTDSGRLDSKLVGPVRKGRLGGQPETGQTGHVWSRLGLACKPKRRGVFHICCFGWLNRPCLRLGNELNWSVVGLKKIGMSLQYVPQICQSKALHGSVSKVDLWRSAEALAPWDELAGTAWRR